jgi:opacity protein-like surface antigen
MTSRHVLAAIVAALAVACASSASSAELAAEGQVGYFSMAAKQTANALFDSSGGVTFGGGARFALDNGLFVAAAWRAFSKDGERVFVTGPGAPVAKLGFPLAAKVNPFSFCAGYRLRHGHLIVPYAGIGLTVVSYNADSEVAGQPYPDSRTKAGFQVLGGVELGRGLVRGAAEVVWSTVPDAVGIAGVSHAYHENNLGGFTVLGKIVLAFGLGGKPAPDTP